MCIVNIMSILDKIMKTTVSDLSPELLYKRQKLMPAENDEGNTSVQVSHIPSNKTNVTSVSKTVIDEQGTTVPSRARGLVEKREISSSSKDSTQNKPVSVEIAKVAPGSSSEHHRQNDNKESPNTDVTNGLPAVQKLGSSNSLIVNSRQRGNPILKAVRSIPWEYGNIVPDYVMGQSNCALFLSLRYHQLHPNYIYDRLKQLGHSYELRVMLVQVDVKEPHHLLKDLAKICILADCTLVLAFSAEEAGRYLESYKVFEHKPPEAIMEKVDDNFMAKFTDCLTQVKSVNKTDCATLLTAFGTLESIMDSSEEDLSLCPGFGPQKAKRLHSIFHEPFVRPSHKGTGSPSKSKEKPTR